MERFLRIIGRFAAFIIVSVALTVPVALVRHFYGEHPGQLARSLADVLQAYALFSLFPSARLSFWSEAR